MGRRTVLVVEDDASVLSAVSRALASSATVLCACDAEGALRVLEAGTPVDVVLSDFELPGDDGLTLLRHVRDHHPDTAVVLMTGHRLRALGRIALLHKPFSRDELADVLAAALASRAG